MQLQLITQQGGSLDNYFSMFGSETHPTLLEAIGEARELLSYLMEHVEGPAQWVTISHGCLFYLSDRDIWWPEIARVFVTPSDLGYRIKYRSQRELYYWDSFTILEARNVEEAGRMIAEALERAERDLPGRGD